MQILRKILGLLPVVAMCLLWSCTDDSLDGPKENVYDPALDEEMVCLPLSINMDAQPSTKAGNGIVDGSATDHKIDFTTPNESYVIFFDNNEKVKYIKPLYTSSQLGSGGKESEEAYPEYTVTVVTYVPKKDILRDAEGYDENSYLSSLLVVLNGGKIYKKIHDAIYDTDPEGKETVKDNVYLNDILDLKWSNKANYNIDNYTGDDWNADAADQDGRIGFNKDELFTMTNSSYFKEENGIYKPVTATPIDGPVYTNINAYVNQEVKRPTATVYVERMVSKFSAPTFQTEVIGSDRVFRPDQNAMAIVVYTWDSDYNLITTPKNWRIHLLGWAINGDETENYIFKKVDGIFNEVGDHWLEWNDPNHFRSYWSEDPHYRVGGFYPWQYRKAADRNDIISIQAARATSYIRPVLRYNTFEDVLNSWSWRDVLHVHENTFDPYGDWYDIWKGSEEEKENNPYYLDGRASILAGPHLLIAAELYLEKPGGSYIGQFDRVDHIYSDRVRRYYNNEADWFKMFIRDFNSVLSTQEKMNFMVYDWDEHSDGKANFNYEATTLEECRLFLRHRDDKDLKQYDPKAREFRDEKNDPGYVSTELTYAIVDSCLYKGPGTLSTLANVRTGDGRLIPWIEGLHVRKPDGSFLQYTTTNPDDDGQWNDDMYKSFFYEWFGPIDHYNQGYMYYAGDIRHNRATVVNSKHDFYGTVRNHWYKFHVEAINALGIPVDDTKQLIIPGNYNYNDQIIVYLDILRYHSMESIVDVE